MVTVELGSAKGSKDMVEHVELGFTNWGHVTVTVTLFRTVVGHVNLVAIYGSNFAITLWGKIVGC